MDHELLSIINEKASSEDLKVHPDFAPALDDYFVKTGELNLSAAEKKTVATYLSAKALNIARVEKKKILDPSDLKAAMWHFHEPKDLQDTECKRAAQFILAEHKRGRMAKALPSEFAGYLDTRRHSRG